MEKFVPQERVTSSVLDRLSLATIGHEDRLQPYTLTQRKRISNALAPISPSIIAKTKRLIFPVLLGCIDDWFGWPTFGQLQPAILHVRSRPAERIPASCCSSFRKLPKSAHFRSTKLAGWDRKHPPANIGLVWIGDPIYAWRCVTMFLLVSVSKKVAWLVETSGPALSKYLCAYFNVRPRRL